MNTTNSTFAGSVYSRQYFDTDQFSVADTYANYYNGYSDLLTVHNDDIDFCMMSVYNYSPNSLI